MTAPGGVQQRQTGNPAFKEEVYAPAARDQSTMTVAGTVMKAFLFTAILIVGAVMGWSLVEPDASGAIVWPWWSWWLSLGAFVMALITIMNPHGSIRSKLADMRGGNRPLTTRPPSSGGIGIMLNTASRTLKKTPKEAM